jgi:hypothetical protein
MALARREFVRLPSLAAAAAVFGTAEPVSRLLIRPVADPDPLAKVAGRELLRGMTRLFPRREIRFSDAPHRPADLLFELRIRAEGRNRSPESYSIETEANVVHFSAPSAQGLLHSIFSFLERQGMVFGIDGESEPLDPPAAPLLPPPGAPWTAVPRFATRGLLPWPDFLNCISVYNEEDFRAYFEAMLRMRLNLFGMHVYTGAQQWAESYLSFEFGGVGHLAFLDNSASHRWGYLPQRTSRYGMGAAQFYDSEVFGSDAIRLARDPWETAERTRTLLRRGLDYAASLGIRTGIGFEPYQIPDEIWRALPPEVKPAELPDRRGTGPRFDIESATAKRLLETRLAQLLEAYPNLDHVWIWEDEGMNWESRRTGVPLSVTPFVQAHDFLRRHAPRKRLVVAGWGGVARHFADFHGRLPGDVIFSCLSDSLGWDPIHEVFGQLEDRERWPIPWLEDDPSMWLPQFHVHRFQRDVDLAQGYGCQGMLGIHWRHRSVDATAAYFSRSMWDKTLQPAAWFDAFARTQAAPERAPRLARTLEAADRERKLLGTNTAESKDGHMVTHEFSGDYSEAFTFWQNYEADPEVVASQKEVAAELRALTDSARSPRERERLGYWSGHLDFAVAYTDAWMLAHRIQAVLNRAADLRKSGDNASARSLVQTEALPVWQQLARQVRSAMLTFQRIVATRNDLGTLASLHNKFVRLALQRLPLSLAEYLGEMPPEVEAAMTAATAPDFKDPERLIVPVRPSMLRHGESVRVLIVVPGPSAPSSVTLLTRARGTSVWNAHAARLLGRRTYAATLGPFALESQLVEYRFTARAGGATLEPQPSYWVTLV